MENAYLLGGLPPRPPPDLPPVVDGQPAPCGFMGGCPLCLDMNITSFMLLRVNVSLLNEC